jgi:hypothetical protein
MIHGSWTEELESRIPAISRREASKDKAPDKAFRENDTVGKALLLMRFCQGKSLVVYM